MKNILHFSCFFFSKEFIIYKRKEKNIIMTNLILNVLEYQLLFEREVQCAELIRFNHTISDV